MNVFKMGGVFFELKKAEEHAGAIGFGCRYDDNEDDEGSIGDNRRTQRIGMSLLNCASVPVDDSTQQGHGTRAPKLQSRSLGLLVRLKQWGRKQMAPHDLNTTESTELKSGDVQRPDVIWLRWQPAEVELP